MHGYSVLLSHLSILTPSVLRTQGYIPNNSCVLALIEIHPLK